MDESLNMLGWRREVPCTHCGARSHMLLSTWLDAHYECCGTPTEPRSAYGPDRCGRTFVLTEKP